MGHREDLLAGAKRCLYEKGYARTTARDIVAASGTNLASIGYHFGSKEALLTAALLAAFDELDQQLWTFIFPPRGYQSYAEVEEVFARQLALWREHRPLVLAYVEALAQARHLPEVREQLVASYERQRELGTQYVMEFAGDRISEGAARALVSHQAMLTEGLLLQHLLDPDRAPSAADIIEAERAIVTLFGTFKD